MNTRISKSTLPVSPFGHAIPSVIRINSDDAMYGKKIKWLKEECGFRWHHQLGAWVCYDQEDCRWCIDNNDLPNGLYWDSEQQDFFFSTNDLLLNQGPAHQARYLPVPTSKNLFVGLMFVMVGIAVSL